MASSFPLKRVLLVILMFLIGAGIFGALLAREGLDKVGATLVAFGFVHFVMFVTVSLVNFGLYTFRWRYIVNDHLPPSQRIPFWRLYMHRMSGYAMSYILPVQPLGGEPVRVGLLVDDGITADRATSSVVIDLAFELTAYITFVAAGFILALADGVALGKTGLTVAVAVVLFAVILGLFYHATINGKGFFQSGFRLLRLHKSKSKRVQKLYDWLGETEEQMTKFLQRRKFATIWMLGLSLLMISFRAFEQWFVAHFLGYNMTFSQTFLTATIPGVALLLPVPAGLGFLEGGNTALFALLGIPVDALALVLIIRLRDIVFLTLGFTHASRRLVRIMQERLKKRKLPKAPEMMMP